MVRLDEKESQSVNRKQTMVDGEALGLQGAPWGPGGEDWRRDRGGAEPFPGRVEGVKSEKYHLTQRGRSCRQREVGVCVDSYFSLHFCQSLKSIVWKLKNFPLVEFRARQRQYLRNCS